MTTLHLVGLDLSLARTGWAIIRPGESIRHGVITSAPVSSDPAKYYPETLARIRRVVGRILKTVRDGREEGDPMHVVVEGPSYESSNGQPHARAGEWWMTYHLLEKEIDSFTVVTPSTLKQYVTGKGGGKDADKAAVVAAMQRCYPDRLITDDNEADALGLASMLARQLHHPQEVSVQRVHPVFLGSVHWPRWIRDLS